MLGVPPRCRTQGTLSWPVFSLVGTFDVVWTAPGERALHGGLLAQFSL